MEMDPSLLIQMIGAAIGGALLYTIIGVIPGTDETAVLAPIFLAFVLLGMEPRVLLCCFISAIVAKKLTDSIPVAVAGIPGGVMAAPMVPHGVFLKSKGLPHVSIRKMASGSVIGTLVAIPFSLVLAKALTPLAPIVRAYVGPIFFVGTIFLALMTRERWISLFAIIPFAMLIQGLQHLYRSIGAVPEGKSVFISFFLAITIGPMILSMLELLVSKTRKNLLRSGPKEISLAPETPMKGFPNPFRILSKAESLSATIGSLIGSAAFFMSPCGMTVLIGEAFSSKIKDPIKRACRAVSTMDALTNASYISGTLVPLIALGIPLGGMALGPARPLFEAPPTFTIDYNLHHILTYSDFVMASVIGAAVALMITYPIAIKYARRISEFVFKRISHEALMSLFFALVVMLAYRDTGVIGICGVFLVAIVGGMLNRWGVHLGIQFMIFYCSSWLVPHLV
jgi:hypothetical protein